MVGLRPGVRRVSTETDTILGQEKPMDEERNEEAVEPMAQARGAAARIPRLAAAGLVVALTAFAGFVSVQAQREGTLGSARQGALEAATARVPDLLGYEHATLSEDLDRALDQTTGEFTDDYETILDEVVEPTATKRKISTTASVRAAGVAPGEHDRDRIVVLVFLTQTTTARNSGPTETGSRVEVTMDRVGDEWKIAGLKPV